MLATKSVLVVEDDEAIRFGLKLRLETIGCVVTTADNGRLGIDAALQQTPDLILMDIRMPVMDGLTALRELKADRSTADIPVVIASASSEHESLALDLGATYFLCKPYANESLFATLRSAL